MEKKPTSETSPENPAEAPNPNSIGEVLSIGNDLPTSPNKVYRSFHTKEATDDIEKVES